MDIIYEETPAPKDDVYTRILKKAHAEDFKLDIEEREKLELMIERYVMRLDDEDLIQLAMDKGVIL